jgi:hypothetical protein
LSGVRGIKTFEIKKTRRSKFKKLKNISPGIPALPNLFSEMEMLKQAGVGFSGTKTLSVMNALRHFASKEEGLRKVRDLSLCGERRGAWEGRDIWSIIELIILSTGKELCSNIKTVSARVQLWKMEKNPPKLLNNIIPPRSASGGRFLVLGQIIMLLKDN